MKNYFLVFFSGLLFLAILSSCRSIKEPQLLSVENLSVTQFGLKESNISFDMQFFNPNNQKLKLKQAEGDAWLDGNPLGHFTIDTLVQIPAKENFRLPVNMTMDMRHFVENISAALMDKQVTLKIDGMAKLGKGIIFINYPVHYEGKQKLGELLK